MKKITTILSVFLLALVLVACSGHASNDLTTDQANEKIANKNSFMLIVESSTCGACKAFKPTVEKFEQDNPNYEIYTITIDKLKDEKGRTEFLHKFSITATPTTLFFKDGELKTSIEGVIDEEKLATTYKQTIE